MNKLMVLVSSLILLGLTMQGCAVVPYGHPSAAYQAGYDQAVRQSEYWGSSCYGVGCYYGQPYLYGRGRVTIDFGDSRRRRYYDGYRRWHDKEAFEKQQLREEGLPSETPAQFK